MVVGTEAIEDGDMEMAVDTKVLEFTGPVSTRDEETDIELEEGEEAEVDVGSRMSVINIPLPMSQVQLASRLKQKSGQISMSSMAKLTADDVKSSIMSLTLLALK